MSTSAKRKQILVVDDSPVTLEVLQRILTSAGYKVFIVPGVSEATEILSAMKFDLVITDLKMPKASGLDLVRHVRENFKETEVIMITGYPSIDGAVKAVKLGAEEFLAKPFTGTELLSAVQCALDKVRIRSNNYITQDRVAPLLKGLVGNSDAMSKIFIAINKAASTSATVLISGESGTGKELVARAIHYSGVGISAPFVPVNCGCIPEELLESELFGHVKGAFTGAIESRAGLFHAADGGTIFLDEISDMSLSMQIKLLRVLQDKEVCMVGSNKIRKVNVRILAATNKDLYSLMKKKLFREDLFYRLNVITISIPPLRERGDDILLLTQHFVKKFSKELGKPLIKFSDNALKSLLNYNWPGNVRELENVIQQLIVMNDGNIIEVPDLPSLLRFSALKKAGFTRTLAEVEYEYINNVLMSVNGNKTKAAEILQIDRKTLREKLKKMEHFSS
jgi:two-component system response regulator HydG